MRVIHLIYLISLIFSIGVQADDSCEVPACNKPKLFQDLRDSNQLIDDRPSIVGSLVNGITSVFGPDHNCPTNRERPAPSTDGITRVSDIFTQGPASDVGSLSTLTPDRAQQLFNTLKNDCRIPFEMNTDGCYHRAHAMAKLAGDQGISVAKAFFKPDEFGGLTMRNPLSGDYVTPTTHAAISVAVRDASGQIRPYIIDPSVADRPLPVDEYRRLISTYDSPRSVQVQFASRYRFNRSEQYQLQGYHENTLIGWGSGDAYKTEYDLNDFRRIQEHFRSDNPNRCNCVGRVLNEFWSMIPPETNGYIQNQCNQMTRRQ